MAYEMHHCYSSADFSLFTTGCASPVGVKKLDPKTVQRTLTANVLTDVTVSPFTAQILNSFGLGRNFIISLHR